MFLDIQKIFDKNFVTGYLLPSIVFGIFSAVLISISFDVNLLDIQIDTDGSIKIANAGNATYFLGLVILGCILLSISLLMLNRTLIRFVEGYYPPISWLLGLQIWRYNRLQIKYKELKSKYLIEKRKDNGDTSKYQKLINKAKTKEATEFPYRKDLIISTRFGNVLRSSETYSKKMYGADIIPIWPRLIPLVDDAHKVNLFSAKAGVDFAINTFYLSIALAIETAILFEISVNRINLWYSSWYIFCIFILGAVGAYFLAVNRAKLWGNYLRATSDLYLDKLLSALGYEKRTDEVAARDLWNKISVSF